MALVPDHLRGQVLGCAAEGVGDAFAVAVGADFAAAAGGAAGGGGGQVLGKAEVDEFQVPVGVQEDVFRFQVPVGDVDGVVQVGEDEGDFGGVELDGGKGEAAGAAEVGEDLAAGAVFELG